MHILAHFLTITRHRHKVMANCFRAGIPWQGLLHDLSKYSLTEFVPGAKYWQGNRSPNEKEREIYGYSKAWMHHKGRNKHHFEYWNDLNINTHRYEPVKMPRKYVAEMVCDRIAASKIYGGKNYDDSYALKYFNRGRPRMNIHPETADETFYFLSILAEKGEKEVFKELRKYIKKKDYKIIIQKGE